MPKVTIPVGVILAILAFFSLGSMVGEKKTDKVLGLIIGYGISVFLIGLVIVIGFLVLLFIIYLFLPWPKKKKRGKG